MADFKIRRGLSTALFSEPGVVNPKLVIEEGCWYLCTDTAELFLGVLLSSGELVLKRINEENALNKPVTGPADGSFEEATELFIKINSEAELPTEFEVQDFNPNITYFIPVLDSDGLETGKVSTFIFDKDIQGYVCTNNVDEQTIKTMVLNAIEVILEETVAEKLPEAVEQAFSSTILYGGDAK